MSDVFEHTVTRLRAPRVPDRYSGEDRFDWSRENALDKLPITDASVQPEAGAEEAAGDRELVTSRWRLFAEGRPDLSDDDRVRWMGHDYQIEGAVGVFDDDLLPHITCLLARATG